MTLDLCRLLEQSLISAIVNCCFANVETNPISGWRGLFLVYVEHPHAALSPHFALAWRDNMDYAGHVHLPAWFFSDHCHHQANQPIANHRSDDSASCHQRQQQNGAAAHDFCSANADLLRQGCIEGMHSQLLEAARALDLYCVTTKMTHKCTWCSGIILLCLNVGPTSGSAR
jgi:hypothetical protein